MTSAAEASRMAGSDVPRVSNESASNSAPMTAWKQVICVSLWVGSMYLSLALMLLLLYRLFAGGPRDATFLLLLAALLPLTVVPLKWTSGSWSRAFIAWTAVGSSQYFSAKVVLEDPESVKAGTPYVIAYEPHSSLPVAMPMTFAPEAKLLPKALRGQVHGLASSVCFQVPLVRQLWWWLGVRPADKATISALLKSGKSVVLVPGGVQECLLMRHDEELAYVRRRTGFIKLAIQNGAAVVPVFAFGQSAAYSWVRMGPPLVPAWAVSALSRYAGAVPMWIYGVYGTCCPHRTPITLVFGRPIEVPHLASPPPEVVQQLLDRYITDLAALYERHKDACGSAHLQLRIL